METIGGSEVNRMNWEMFDNYYITSDLHLFHKNIMKYEPISRNFSSVDEMNEAILSQIDALPPNSILINLGDVYLSFNVKKEQIAEIVQRMKNNNKTLVLILGNHDRKIRGVNDPISYFKEIGFDKVQDTPYKFMEYAFRHEPFPVERPSDDLQGFTGSFPPAICIHGHTHSKMVDEDYFIETTGKKTNPSRYINVCWDVERKIYHLPDVMRLSEERRVNYINSWKERI